MPRYKEGSLVHYALTEKGWDYLRTLEPLESPLSYSRRNARRLLLELLDDIKDGGGIDPNRFWDWFDTPVPPHALRAAAQELRREGMIEPFDRSV